MFLPAEYAWLEPVLVASAVVFVIDLIGNTITFSNRFLNALTTAVVFGLIFAAIIHFGYGDVSVSVQPAPSPTPSP